MLGHTFAAWPLGTSRARAVNRHIGLWKLGNPGRGRRNAARAEPGEQLAFELFALDNRRALRAGAGATGGGRPT